jgi:hypothetical protein
MGDFQEIQTLNRQSTLGFDRVFMRLHAGQILKTNCGH